MMNEIANLPMLVSRAAQRLLDARTSAEVLEVKKLAEAALHYAKVTEAANETHADCLRIITRAEMRMADEIDRGQAEGQLAPNHRPVSVQGADTSTYDELGIDRRRVAEWREVRDAGEEVVEGAITDALAEGRPPTKADIRRCMDVHYSSATDDWSTPQELFDLLDSEFGFELDVCALPASAKCERYFTPEDDGLAQDWTGVCWMNPPYGDVIGQWVEKARLSAEAGATVVCLVPARVDTNWWWDNCLQGEIRFLRGRLKFGGGATGAPFPSAVVIFGREPRTVWWAR